MSGPIVRRYGFPNFEQIFGKKDLEHGAEPAESTAPADPPKEAPTAPEGAAAPKGEAEAKPDRPVNR